MAFPQFHGQPPLPSWQGRQPKRYFAPGEVGFIVRNPPENPIEDVSTFIRDTLNGSESLEKSASLSLLIEALNNRDSHRTTNLPGSTMVFMPVKAGNDLLDDMALLNVIRDINTVFHPIKPLEGSAPSNLAGALPNWFSGAQQSAPIGTGGSAGLPIPATTPPRGLSLQPPADSKVKSTLDQTPKNHAEKVNIYVLDTAPDANLVEGQRANFSGTNADATPLINDLFGSGTNFSDNATSAPYARTLSWNNQFSIYYDLSPDPDDPARLLMDTLVNRANVPPAQNKIDIINGYFVPHHDHDMRDHGLFASSLIAQQYGLFYQNVAANAARPAVTIHLIQVLSNFGVGTLESFARGLAKVAEIQQQPDNQGSAAVVNCSWVLSAPTQLDHMSTLVDPKTGLNPLEHYFLDEIAQAQKTASSGSHFSESIWFMQGIFALHEQIAFISQHLAQVIACAGNDRISKTRPSARHPAAYTEVIGVTSLSTITAIDPASYANIADDPATVGFAIWGGDNDLASGVVVEDETVYFTDGNNSLVGLYFNGFFPDPIGNQDPGFNLADLYFTQQGVSIPPDLTSAMNPGIRSNINGLAQWTGTSFAAPLVTALFAACLAYHWDSASATNFAEAENAITAASPALTIDHEIVVPLV